MIRKAILMAGVMLLAACNDSAGAEADEAEGKGPAVKRDYQVAAFTSVSLGGSHDVIVTVGGAQSVRAEGPADYLDRLEIKVDNGDLQIGAKKNDWSLSVRRNRPHVTVYVTVPALSAASIGGAGDMKIDRVQGERFAASIAGSGDMQIGNLAARELAVEIAGSGGVAAKGSAGNAAISIAGSGDVDAGGVESKTANISIVGSGNVSLRATEKADISIMGSGDVSVTGPAKCQISKMGSGEARCEG
jgi:hypothetical protein